ncbi:MAG: hypothetical protein Tsb0021_11080 [Chlamydiales bacterium]
MALPKVTRQQSLWISLGVFLVGLGIISYHRAWWPEIMLAIGASLLTKQWLRGRRYDMGITIFVFGGIYLFYKQPFSWDYLMPVLFVVGGIYLIARELFFPYWREGTEEVEDVRQEIKEAEENEHEQ